MSQAKPMTGVGSRKSETVDLPKAPGKSRDRMLADFALSGVANSAKVSVDFAGGMYGELSLTDCVTLLVEKSKDVHAGKLKDAETMLMSQAVALDAIFGSLALRAQRNMGEYVNAADRYLRLALKAQAQCRATLETLAAIKNPPAVFAKQANISAGSQQVNNTVNVPGPALRNQVDGDARAEKSISLQNELLGE